MEVLVTGGTGYIGSHTLVALLEAGYQVVVVDSLYNSHREVIDIVQELTGKQIAFYPACCQDKDAMERIFQAHPDIEAAIHFASLKAVNESTQAPLRYYRENIDGLLTLLEVMQAHGVNQLVFSSSCTVYGESHEVPVTEQSPWQDATSPYGYTKQVSERILMDCANANKQLSVTALRYFNPIGAHPSGLLGEWPLGATQNLMPALLEAAAGQRPHLCIWGNDYPTADGTCVRDYIHVWDLAKAHVAALRQMKEATPSYRIYNIGTGQGVSVKQLVNTFEKATGVAVPVRYQARREGDIERIWANSDKAAQELHWKAQSTLEETLLSAWRWHQHITKDKTV